MANAFTGSHLCVNFFLLKVDVAVVEVGVGGRTDATNVIDSPVVTAVTALGYDHMDVLGDTLAEIAFEKSGIFKVKFFMSTSHCTCSYVTFGATHCHI